MSYETVDYAWDTAMEAVECGQIFACVPVVRPDGTVGVWTATGTVPPARDDTDILVQAYVCIKHSRLGAERSGFRPVP